MPGLGIELTKSAMRKRSGGSSVFSPLAISGLIGWYDASDYNSLTVDNGRVTAISNRVSGGLPLKSLGTHGTSAPVYDPANTLAGGNPALLWASGEECGLELYHPVLDQAVETPVADMFIVCAYKEGVDADFDGYTRLIADAADHTICQGQPGSNGIRATSTLQRASKNGASFSASLLPLPLSVLRFSAANQGLTDFSVSSFGRKEVSSLSRSWNGPICEVLAFSTPLSSPDIEQVGAYFHSKWGIVMDGS